MSQNHFAFTTGSNLNKNHPYNMKERLWYLLYEVPELLQQERLSVCLELYLEKIGFMIILPVLHKTGCSGCY